MNFESFYLDEDEGILIGVDGDGYTIEYSDWTPAEMAAARRTCADPQPGVVYTLGRRYDGGVELDGKGETLPGEAQDGDGETGDEQAQDGQAQGGSGDGDGDGSGDGDGDGSGDGDGDGSGDGDGDGSGDGETGDQGDQGDEQAQGDDGETGETGETGDGEAPELDQGPIEDALAEAMRTFNNPIADELWSLFGPRTGELVQAVGRHVYESALLADERISAGNTVRPGLTVKLGKLPDIKVEGYVHFMMDTLLRLMHRRINILLVGPPGTGKSFMVEQAAEILGLPFSVSAFGPQATEASLKGWMMPDGVVGTEFKSRFLTGGVHLFDEIDNGAPSIVTTLNAALANTFMEFPDGMGRKHPEFSAVAAANTWGTGPTAEFSGRQKMDPASLNRFMKVAIPTDEAMEKAIITDMLGSKVAPKVLKRVIHIRRAVAGLGIKHFVGMRDSIQIAKAMQGEGAFTLDEAVDMQILNPLTDDQRAKIDNYIDL